MSKSVTITVPKDLHDKITADAVKHGTLVNAIRHKYMDQVVCPMCGSLCEAGKINKRSCG